jgi:hypothetical protein
MGDTKPRRGLSKRVRFEVFKRDGFRCQYCGATPLQSPLHCDHVEPVAGGGSNDMDNLVTACQDCNLGKSDVPLSSIPESLETRAANVAEREEQIAGYQSILRARRNRIDDEAQAILDKFCLMLGRTGIPSRDFSTIKMFVERLGAVETEEACEIACGKFRGYARAFRYFCGVCWKKLRENGGID